MVERIGKCGFLRFLQFGLHYLETSNVVWWLEMGGKLEMNPNDV
jgi:hypothetical protein